MARTEPTTRGAVLSSAEASYVEERALHRRICAGDESALLECLDRFGHVVYCALFRLTDDIRLTEDLTERAFVSLWRSPETFDPRRGPMALQLLAVLSPAAGARRGAPDPSTDTGPGTRAAA